MGLFQYDRGYLSHQGVAVRLADALRRGAPSAAANHSIDFLAVDGGSEMVVLAGWNGRAQQHAAVITSSSDRLDP
jgi:hypothetical protein